MDHKCDLCPKVWACDDADCMIEILSQQQFGMVLCVGCMMLACMVDELFPSITVITIRR